jgi:clan AA aspartic protease
MGTFSQVLRLDSIDGERSLEIDALVDTGASYTIVPTTMLARLGVEPIDRIRLALADGRPVDYELGQAVATVNGRSIPTLVLFGEDGARPLLGAYTLEGLRLAVDPREGRLVPGRDYHL